MTFAVADAHFGERGDHVAVERLAGGAGFLGAVEDGDGFYRSRGCAATKASMEKGRNRRTLSRPTFSPRGEQGFHGLVGHFGAGAHHDDDALGIGRADVVEQMVLPAGDLRRSLSIAFCTMVGAGQVVRVAGFARLEVDVGVLGGAADDGTVGG